MDDGHAHTIDRLERRLADLERRLAAAEQGRRRRPPGRAGQLVAASVLLALLVAPLAIAGSGGGERVAAAGNERGEAVEIGLRNRSDRETGLIANGDGYSLRLSNVNRGEGGGAIFGCRAAAGRESCVNADNLADGQAFSFRSREGSSAGHFQVDGPNAVPFTTNAAGVVANLNADKVDGLDAEQLRGQQGPAGPAGPTGATGPQGPPGPFAQALPTGQTLRGGYGVTSYAVDPAAIDGASYTFAFPLATAPVVRFVPEGGTPPAECPGSVAAPEAAPGNLCVYERTRVNLQSDPSISDPRTGTPGAGTIGFGVVIAAGMAGDEFYSVGTWAVTAP